MGRTAQLPALEVRDNGPDTPEGCDSALPKAGGEHWKVSAVPVRPSGGS